MIIKSTKLYNLGKLEHSIKIVWDIRVDKRKFLFIEYRNWEDERITCWLEHPDNLDDETSYFFLDWFAGITENRDYTLYGNYEDKKYDKTSDIEDFEDEIEDGLRY